jgi:hypothetical protein
MKDRNSDRYTPQGFPRVFNAFAKFAGMMGISYVTLYMVFKLMKLG